MTSEILNKQLAIRDEATAFYARGDFDSGDTILANSAEALPDFIKLECMGNRYFYKRDLDSAVRCYEEGINLNPDHIVARYQYLAGVQLEKKGELVEAFKRYQAAIGVAPLFVDSYVELGGLLVKVGDLKGALHCYRDAARIDDAPANLFNLKEVLQKLAEEEPGEYGEELSAISQACEVVAAKMGVPHLPDKSW